MAWTDHIPQWLRRAARPAHPLYRAVQLWSEAGGLQMSAAMSFYGILSLAPLLLLLVGMLGWWLDRQVLEQGLLAQLGAIIGERGTALIAEALKSAKEPSQGIGATVAGFVVLLSGATGVFTELQDAFERLWSHGQPAGAARHGWRYTATLRLRGVGYVLVFGFLLLVSLVFTTLLNMFSGWAGNWVPLETLLRALNELAGLLVCCLLFVGLMRLSGGPKPRMRYLLVGAFAGAILFTVGRQLLALYLSKAAVVSAYGAAGSLIVLLMWIYFSSAVLLFGAGCARALEEQYSGKGAALGGPQGGHREHGRHQQDGQAPAVAHLRHPQQAQ
ncbi:MAG: YihY/virulence factor BrkB family protein [Pseudomonadota bacterium]